MDTRGQGKPPAKPRRRRWWLLALAAFAVAIGGMGVYVWLSQPPPVEIVWEHQFSGLTPNPKMQPLPQGGVAFSYADMMQFDRDGELASVYTPPLNISKTMRTYSRVNSTGEFYFAPDDKIIALDFHGNQRWESRLPDIGVNSNKPKNRCVFISVLDNGNILATYNSGEFAKLDRDGNVLLHTASPSSPVFFRSNVELTDELFAADAQTGMKQQISNAVIFNKNAEMLWSSTFPGFGVHSIAKFQDLLIIDMLDGHVYAVDFTGALQWEYENPDPAPTGSAYNYYIVYVVDDQFVLVLSEQRAVALDHEGNQLWEVKGNYFTAAVSASAETQYIIDNEWSEFQANTRQNIGISLSRYYPSIWSQLPFVPSHTTILRLDHGRVTKRWRAPDNVEIFTGPGADGEFYLYSYFQNNSTLYCVRLD